VSNEKNTGGPAFPVAMWCTDQMRYIDDGMTLRDYFAAKAMQAFIANDNLLRSAIEHYSGGSEMSVALLSYDQADAMLKAREA
jgi:hypothetical protein